jgi:hypothetical protein
MSRFINLGSNIINLGLGVRTLFVSNTHHNDSQLLTYAASINEHQNKADDDEYEQKNNEVQTVMLLSSLFMGGGFQIISGSHSKTILFTVSLSLAISFLFLSVLFGLATIHKMAKFMAGRARERNRQLRNIRQELMQGVTPPCVQILTTNPRVIHNGILIETFHDWFVYKCDVLCFMHLIFFKLGSVSIMITMISIITNIFVIPMVSSIIIFFVLEWKERSEVRIEWDLPV